MRSNLIGFLLILCFGSAIRGQQHPTQAVIADSWLSRDCDLQDDLFLQVASAGQTVEPYFIAAVQGGPSPNQLAQVGVVAGEQFDAMSKLLASGEKFGLDPKYLSVLSSESREQFVADYVNDFVLAYRARGVSGLGIVSGPAGRSILETLAVDPSSPLQATAQLALRQLNIRPLDVNSDGFVNCADLAIVKASFGKKVGEAGFDPRADVNKDGIVNVLDLSAVARQIPAGTTCP